ncbi:hypothetical protein ACF0H5_015708 [Mactra antiquata]
MMNASFTVKLICHRKLPLCMQTYYCALSNYISACNRLTRSVSQSRHLKVWSCLSYRQYSHAKTHCTAFCNGRNRVDNTAYQMSVSEHSEFIHDFLSELNIERVDMIVSNRHSVYTAVNLCATQKDFYCSLAMINPPGLQYTKMMKPFIIHKRIAYAFENRMILHELIRGVVNIIKYFIKKRHWSTSQVITFSRNVSTLSFKDEENRANQLQIRNKPLLAIYGNDSTLLDVKSSKAYQTSLGIPESSFIEIEDETLSKTAGTISEDKVAFHILTDSENILDTHTMFIRRKLWNFFRSNHQHKTGS